jgi:hypothetical protein
MFIEAYVIGVAIGIVLYMGKLYIFDPILRRREAERLADEAQGESARSRIRMGI